MIILSQTGQGRVINLEGGPRSGFAYVYVCMCVYACAHVKVCAHTHEGTCVYACPCPCVYMWGAQARRRRQHAGLLG